MERSFSIKELKQMINENSNEFKAKIGKDVEKENKSNNEKAVKDAKKRSGAEEAKPKESKFQKNDFNRTTLDSKFDVEPCSDYKKRVHAQAKGYTSTTEENNGIEKVGEFNDAFYKASKESNKERSENEKKFKQSGLRGRELPEKVFDSENMYESKSVKTARFKKTEFLTEEHMLSKIPDELKKDGNVFKMVDKNDNTYIVEWKKDIYKNESNPVILEHINNKMVNETLEKMKRLYNFKSTDNYTKSTCQERINEGNDNFISTLNKIREIK
jgi:hypothetical protein